LIEAMTSSQHRATFWGGARLLEEKTGSSRAKDAPGRAFLIVSIARPRSSL
jgi:hypothetical protein